MPKIRQFTRTVNPTQFVQARATAADFGSGLGRAAQELGAKVEEIKIKRDKSEYVRQLSEFQLENVRREQELKEAEFGADDDIIGAYGGVFDNAASEFEVNIPSSMRDQWEADKGRMALGFAQSGVNDQVHRAGVRAKLAAKDTQDNLTSMVALDTNKFDAAMNVAEKAASGIKDPSLRLEAVENIKDALRVTKASTVANNNPADFLARANAGEFEGTPNLMSIIQRAQSAVKAGAEKSRATAEAKQLLLDAKEGNAFLDPANKTHTKVLDAHYNDFPLDISEGLRGMDTDAANIGMQFVNTYKIVPESMQSTLRGMMNGGDRNQRAFAYNMVSEIQDVKAAGFSDSEIQDASIYISHIAAGHKPEQAMDVIDEYNSAGFAPVREYREKLYSQMVKDVDTENIIGNMYDGIFIAQPSVTSQAMVDFDMAFKRAFVLSGNKDVAIDAAKRTIANKHTMTNLMGERKVMEYAPEQHGVPQLSDAENRAWMKDDLKTTLRGLGHDDYLPLYDLHPMPESKDRVQQGLTPSYFILNRENNDYIRNEKNEPVQFYFDLQAGVEKHQENIKKADKKRSNKTGEARAIRAMMADPNVSTFDKFLMKSAQAANNAARGLKETGSDITGFAAEKTQGAGEAIGHTGKNIKEGVSGFLFGEE